MAVENFQGALRTYLLAGSALYAAVSTKIYSVPVPQQTAEPYVVIQKIGKAEDLYTLSGTGSVIRERWQIDVYGSSMDNAESISKLIYERLHMKIYENWSGYKIYLSKWENENVFNSAKDDGSESSVPRIQQDFMIKRSFNTI